MFQVSVVNKKQEGNISAFWKSLNGDKEDALPKRYSDLKRKLVSTPEAERSLVEGWRSILASLKENNPKWAAKGVDNIPQVNYKDLIEGDNNSAVAKAIRECGNVVIKGAVDQETALAWKEGIREYIKKNPGVKGFPAHDPQVFELYWTPSQIAARTHPRLVSLVVRMNELWDASPSAEISRRNPIFYADRCRERHAGDTSFALGPHSDSGTIERWENESYSSCYRDGIIENWETWNPWNIDGRVKANTDMYDSPGGSSVFRTFQGWLGLSHTGPGEGTLRVHPSVKHATAYFWMRPFFSPIKTEEECATRDEYLDADNWRLDLESTAFPGSPPGRGQEFSDATHPHLEVNKVITSIPRVEPGDFVFWHCDGIHAVEAKHGGTGDSSVMYIGAAPLTAGNAEYLAQQRATFLSGVPPPDYPGGKGESGFTGRPTDKDLKSPEARRGMGFEKFVAAGNATEGEQIVIRAANDILGLTENKINI
ncbi:hypothetical protein EST38_g10318 [Candolleomyces aberdarensis]|uniref:DUF1479-domain-containing protein n=1 Tax=Candolleomyces aberdarensis TaxID=2316362 RepID=A0A4Q2DAX4_9AGAR|nr:hypothetical protein EST38_g10318 [Candolleomyces aberdarensis]